MFHVCLRLNSIGPVLLLCLNSDPQGSQGPLLQDFLAPSNRSLAGGCRSYGLMAQAFEVPTISDRIHPDETGYRVHTNREDLATTAKSFPYPGEYNK